ncbi:alanine racemase [Kiloniella sp. EL199]|uniref:alanine racemase n=1 Tax=Kiloniella sp. EL199 TaxID=2107581 RepID=UPI000EA3FA6C|nr:alanine racemase [Kiloniella sp. EL199]
MTHPQSQNQSRPPNNVTFSGTSPRLTVDLGAVVSNFKTLRDTVDQSGSSCAGVLKANSYGMGYERIAEALWAEGCKTFFVALVGEGVKLRALFPKAVIYVLSPYLSLDTALLREYHLIPCLYDLEGIDLWIAENDKAAPAALHFETGINRLGLSTQDLEQLLENRSRLNKLDLKLVMSHLSSADEQQSNHNQQQLESFKHVRAAFPNTPASLANTAGIFLGAEYHFDLVRPGIGLYGHDPHYYENRGSRLKPVATFAAPLAQVKELKAGEAVGYGATELDRNSTIGVILCGYADGVMRALFKPDSKEGHQVTINGYKAPILGRVSMDMITIDLTTVPKEARAIGSMVEIFGNHSPVENAAAMAGTSAYELFTRVSGRAVRKYV